MGRRAARAAAEARDAVTALTPTRRQVGLGFAAGAAAQAISRSGVLDDDKSKSQTDSAGLIDRRGRRVEAR
jgi:hypothetical protein